MGVEGYCIRQIPRHPHPETDPETQDIRRSGSSAPHDALIEQVVHHDTCPTRGRYAP